MAIDGRVEELLSAYLMGDIQPEERAAVEKLLAEKNELRALVKDLNDLRELLKQGERKVSPQMIETLRYRVMSELKQHARYVSVPALLAATLKGDVTPQERETVENYLQTHPSAQREMENLRKLDGMLTQGKLEAAPELSEKLTARLKARLPAEAFNTPAIPASTVRASASSATMLRPSVRVFTAKQNVVRRNAVWFAAAAVAVTVTLGVVIVRSLSVNPEPNNTVVNQTPNNAVPANTNNGEVAVTPENKLPVVPVAPEQQPPVAPAPHVVDNTPIAPQQRTPAVPQVSRPDTVVSKSAEPRNTPETPKQAVAQEVPRSNDTPIAPPQVANNNAPPRDNIGVPIPSSVANNNNPALAPDNPPSIASNVPAANTPVGPSIANNEPARTPTQDVPDVNQAQGSTAVVLTVKDGTVQGRTTDNPTPVNLQVNAQVTSGTEVSTDRGRIALQLPGDGRLWINRGSNVQLTMKNKNTTVTLNAGEIAYRAPSSGSLTVIINGVQLVRDAKSVDAKLSGKQLTVFGMDKTASVGQKNKAVTITAGTKAVVTLDSDELPLKEAGAPDNWRTGLDGGDDTPPKTTTSESKKQKRRGS